MKNGNSEYAKKPTGLTIDITLLKIEESSDYPKVKTRFTNFHFRF
jgi:hypothetical protein